MFVLRIASRVRCEILQSLQGTAATKVNYKLKRAEGTAEKRGGRRGPASVWGSGAAGTLCAIATIYGVGGPAWVSLWQLGFLASFCTKLSDTMGSEIGKAFGKTTSVFLRVLSSYTSVGLSLSQ